MNSILLNNFSCTFKDLDQERIFKQANWGEYSTSLRSPLFFLAGFILAGGYLDFGWYGFTLHFLVFSAIRIFCVVAITLLAWSTYRETPPRLFDIQVHIIQLLILGLWFAIFADRVFFNDAGITSETFYTVLFVTYPLLVFYVIRGKILYSLLNSILALLLYIVCVVLNPVSEIQFRITEILALAFFIYYSCVLQRKINTEERLRFNSEKQQQVALNLANKESKDKSFFIAATSHDLRQPLHALSLYIEILQNSAKEEAERQEIITHAKSSLASLNDLLVALLDISKLDAGEVEFNVSHFRVDELLRRMTVTYKKIAENKGVDLHIHLPELVVETDPIMLERAVGNLLNNAIQHTNKGKILLACRPNKNAVSIEVWDQGVGIPDGEFENIFSEYHRLKNTRSERSEGLGLGLAIVKRIAKALNFELSVRSRIDYGSVFSMRLAKGNTAKVPCLIEQEKAGSLSLSGMKIIIVDDEIEVLHSMKTLLESWGCTSIVAGSQKDLLPQLVVENVPDIILCDLNLPDNVLGTELVESVRQFFSKPIPALLVTGDTNVDKEEVVNLGSVVILFKPVRAAKLRIALSRMWLT